MTSGSLSKAVHLPTPSRPHYYRFIALFVVAIVIAHVVFSPLDSSEGVSRGKVKIGRYLLTNPKQWRIPEAPVEDQGYRKMGEWCTEEEYLDGEWVKREEEVDMSNIRKVFSYTDRGRLKCVSKDVGYGADPAPDDPVMSERILETAQYVYRPRSGCRQHSWNRWNFAKFCLRSRAGCTLVGDSLPDQIYTTLVDLMVSGSGPEGGHDSLFNVHAHPEAIFTISVNKAHPDATKLSQAAGVATSRFDRPVFSFHREHHLVHREDLDKAFKNAPGYQPFVGGPPYSEQKFVADRSWWYEKWTARLHMGVQFEPKGDAGPRILEENSVIGFSMGPHWSPRELWPQRYVMKNDSYDHVLRGYQGTFAAILQNVTQIAKEHKITAWWRSNTPGHYECFQYDHPENDRTDQLSTRNPSLEGFNWMHYPKMDKYIATHLGYKPSNFNRYLRPTQYAMRYLDFWTMSIKRPDAHLKPAIDCLHFCQPSLPNEWLNFWWHMMVTSALNSDYDDEGLDDSWIAAGMPT